jgi:phosphohistidine phosphatase SixA
MHSLAARGGFAIVMTHRLLAIIVVLATAAWPLQARESQVASSIDTALVQEMRAGAVVLMRHTQTTSGVGDPAGWRLGHCPSQRNLDAIGTAHARRIGRWFARHKLKVTAVRNSPWCRTRDTASLAFGRNEDWAALANIFEDRSGAQAQADLALQALQASQPGELEVWVSHGVTIGYLLGQGGAGLAMGEAVVVRRGHSAGAPPVVLGRLMVP